MDTPKEKIEEIIKKIKKKEPIFTIVGERGSSMPLIEIKNNVNPNDIRMK